MIKRFLAFTLVPCVILSQSNPIDADSEFIVSDTDDLKSNLVIDAKISFDEALSGATIPESLKKELTMLTVYYYGFDNLLHEGQIIVNKKVAADVLEIFEFILETRFPIEKVIPLSDYKWSDYKSMEDNNTSCFNYRFVSGSRVLSLHASGCAIDINPRLNPYIKNNLTIPADAAYNPDTPGTLHSDSQLVKEFKKRGWSWGGDWKSIKDYQHFQKEIEPSKSKH